MDKKIMGSISNLNKTVLAELESIYTVSVPRSEIISADLALMLATLTEKINKEIAVYINRQGTIEMVSVGSSEVAAIPAIWLRRSQEGLNGLRCIHTHPSGNSCLSQPDLSALANLHLDLICAIGVQESCNFSFAHLDPQEGLISNKVVLYGPFNLEKMLFFNPLTISSDIEKQLARSGYLSEEKAERAIIAGILSPQIEPWEEEAISKELQELAKTAGLVVVGEITQKKERPDAAHFLGKGKLAELSLMCQNLQADTVVFERPLSPSQLSNLTDALGVKVLDKTTLILDIFAQRAQSKEGKLQVELAQLNYMLPRLIGQGGEMSRLGGGVGTRGPGETKLETDRRYIRRRVQILEKELQEVRKHRAVQQKSKQRQNLPQIALVGYTNAGKSSLLNALTDEHIYAEDQLFATLDTTTRGLTLPNHARVLLTDTVGFIRDLPHQLVEAFKATLDELQSADLLVHVIDASNKNVESQIESVHQVLKALNVLDKDMIYVFNKIDKVAELPNIIGLPKGDCCYISARSGDNLATLLDKIVEKLANHVVTVQLAIPLAQGNILNKAYGCGLVEALEYTETAILCRLIANQADITGEIREYIIQES